MIAGSVEAIACAGDPGRAGAAPATLDRQRRRRSAALGGLAAALIAIAAADLCVGAAGIGPGEVAAACLRPWAGDPAATIVWTCRLPSVLLAILVGAALGLAGAVMQALLGNPLASPFTLGISAAAGCGAALGIAVLGGGVWATTGSALGLALVCAGLIAAVARWARGRHEVVLAGIGLLFLFQAATACVQYIADEHQLAAIVFWIFGSLEGATWPGLAALAAALALAGWVLAARAWQLTALGLGEARAAALGVDAVRLRVVLLATTSALTAAAVCVAGSIGFVGLVGPHLARLVLGEDQRWLLPGAALGGAILLAGADLAAKLAAPAAALPVGIATAVIGVPALAGLLLLRRERPC